MKPSTAAVLALLRQRGSYGATDRDGLLYAHTSRMAARVWDLRRDGFDITTSYETKRDVRFARYRLHENRQLQAFSDARDANTSPSVGVTRIADGQRVATAGLRSRLT